MVRAVSCGGRGSNAPPRFTSQRGGSIFHLAHHSMKLLSFAIAWLHGCHAARHAEGRGYGREDRDGGLNDEPPYLPFLFIHDFSFV